MGKTDSTGSYSFACDRTSPGSPVLSDGHAVYTPGESESRGGASSYSAYDKLGNLWFVDNPSGGQTYYQDTTGFGSGQGMGLGGTELSPFKFGGGNGCQTDTDLGFILMGHRYYDSRQGRFISQDHAKSGGNWYAYCGNNPVNKADPSGLSDGLPGSLGAPDSRYGGLGGFLDGGGMSNLDGFWSSENASSERGHEQYLAYEEIGLAKIWGPNGYAAHVRQLLYEIAASPIGLKLLSSVFYEKTLNIMYFHNSSKPNSYYNPENDLLSYDSALHPSVMTADGPSDAPPISVLEHELGHDVTGLPDPAGSDTIFDTHGTDNIAVNENPFRAYLGLPDRIDHSADKGLNGSWFNPLL